MEVLLSEEDSRFTLIYLFFFEWLRAQLVFMFQMINSWSKAEHTDKLSKGKT